MNTTHALLLSILLPTMAALCLHPLHAVAQNTSVADSNPEKQQSAQWIWSNNADPAPKNRLTYFRKVVELAEVPADGVLRYAADSNARLWINGHLLRRKVARYHEPLITAEVVNAGPYLRPGKNVVLVLHHNWGDIRTFQRTANKHAGLYLSSSWVHTDSSWRWRQTPEFVVHEYQVPGVIGDQRIRYPQIIDAGRMLTGDPGGVDFDDSNWSQAVVVNDGPWPATPSDVETPGQREYPVVPMSVLAAGALQSGPAGTPGNEQIKSDPKLIAAAIGAAKCLPDAAMTAAAGNLLAGQPWVLTGKAGEAKYVTFDFGRPVHGYPFLKLAVTADARIDLGYCEIARALYNGKMHVDTTGWINPEGVVGPGYADSLIARIGPQSVEFPDERTARWLTLHVHFQQAGEITLHDMGIVKSQYPIEPVGTFECGNELISQIVKLCQIHAEVTMSDTYVDTPGREDGQWIEDARPRGELAARWFGDHRLRQLMIRTLAEGQGADGQLHPFFPSNYPAYPAPYDWSVQWVAMIYDDYMWTGQDELIRRYWPQMCKYWENVLGHVDESGLWRTNHVLADIRVGLRLENNKQSSGIVTPWIIERLRWSVQMARAINQSEQAEKWQAVADRMTEAFRKHHLVPADGTVPAHVGDRFDPAKSDLKRGYSQAGQTIAVTAGLLNPDEARADVEYAFAAPDGSPPAGVTRWNNPTYSYRSLRAMSAVGLSERATRHLIERYAPYLPGHPRNPVDLVLQGPYGGPLPEYWVSREDLDLQAEQIDTAQPADETGSHGWGAVPLLWLHDTVLGVQIVAPGGGKISIAPDAGGLPFIAGHTNTPRGVVWVSYDPQQIRLEVSIPADVEAELTLPRSFGQRIETISAAGEIRQVSSGVLHIRGMGKYIFQAR